MNEDKILKAIANLGVSVAELKTEIGGRLNALELKLSGNRKELRRMQKAQEMQQEQIDELTKRVDALTKSDAIWRSPKGNMVAVDKDSCYEAFEDLGIRRRQAMLTLRELNKIQLDSQGKMTVPVRSDIDGRVVRAVVILR